MMRRLPRADPDFFGVRECAALQVKTRNLLLNDARMPARCAGAGGIV
jgi:hypothetical protein